MTSAPKAHDPDSAIATYTHQESGALTARSDMRSLADGQCGVRADSPKPITATVPFTVAAT